MWRNKISHLRMSKKISQILQVPPPPPAGHKRYAHVLGICSAVTMDIGPTVWYTGIIGLLYRTIEIHLAWQDVLYEIIYVFRDIGWPKKKKKKNGYQKS